MCFREKEPSNVLVNQAREEPFPLHLLPDITRSWIEAMSWFRNARPEFVQLSCISVIDTIVGPETNLIVRSGSQLNDSIKHPHTAYYESSGLFLTVMHI